MRPLSHRKLNRRLGVEQLERREVYAHDFYASIHNSAMPGDVNNDRSVSPLDALLVINELSRKQTNGLTNGLIGGSDSFLDVNNDGLATPQDVQSVFQLLGQDQSLMSASSSPAYDAVFNAAETVGSENLLSASDVRTLLDRASMATKSKDAIIAIVDRTGRILGVRVEVDVAATFAGRPKELAFAIDGAVSKARTAAFFSNNEAPLSSRTVRFISQSTITQREVESWSGSGNPQYQGPGFVAPIGVGGHFPPQTRFTPQVDLFAIEHQSRDSQTHAGADGIKGNADDFKLAKRFNANEDFIPAAADAFFNTWPESYGAAIDKPADASDDEIGRLQSRGIATLPGGVPLYKTVVNADGVAVTKPVSASVNLVGGIGVFFPGQDGFATHEQGFVHASDRNGVAQTEASRTSAPKVLEAEFIALAAAAGGGIVGPKGFTRDMSFINKFLPAAPRFVALNGRIDLVGISLEIYGPTPTRANRSPGIDQVLKVGRKLGIGDINGVPKPVDADDQTYLAGQGVPIGWLVAPHDSSDPNGPTAAEVERIILQGVKQANATRAAIRLRVDSNFRPGARTKMVLAVADTNGELLGLYRMPDATVFSVDVAVAKARNTAYYADPVDLLATDRLDFNDDGVFGTSTSSFRDQGDTLPLGTAASNRTFRFIAEPRFPTGTELPRDAAQGLVNDPGLTLRDQKPSVARLVGPESTLQMPGINPRTGENLDKNNPLPAAVYSDPNQATILSFASFVPSRNFRDPGDATVIINGPDTAQPLANQNGIVFFPGSTSLYRSGNSQNLMGGFGVSGDGVDQDDVVTASGQVGFAPPQAIRADSFTVGRVRLPFQKYNRNPLGM